MRVRYGKPIKVKSLLGKQDAPYSFPNTVSDNGYFIYAKSDNSFAYGYVDSITSQAKAFAVTSGHKYFAYTSWSISTQIYTNVHNGHRFALISDTSTNTGNASTFSATSSYGYSLVEPSFSGSCEVGTCNYNQTQATGDKICYMIIVDLTEIGLDNLTAKEFYDKYNRYFPLIATGEEITIDDKAGQVSLFSGLPSDYQRVECISIINDSTNGYRNGILTSIAWNSITKIKVDLQVINYSTGHPSITNQNIFLRSGTSNNPTTPWINIRNASTPAYSGLDSFSYSTPYDSSSLLINHQTLTFTFTSSSENNIYVGNWGDSAYSGSNKLYEITFYNNDNIIGKLIPCYRKSDNVIGMYDLVGKQFYINQGTGTFLKGDNVNNIISCKVAGGSSDIYYGYNQQIENGQFENGTDRWFMQNGTFSVTDGIATFTQTDLSVGFTRLTQKLINPSIIGHKYFVHFYAKHDHPTTINLKENSNHNTNTFDVPTNTWTLCEVISTSNAISNYATISTRNSELASVCNVDIRDYYVIDLTDWYGAGKEPNTVAEFKDKFTKDYYGFCPTPIKLTRYQIEALPTYGYNQIADINRSTATIRGISFVNNGNNTLTINGTSQKADNIFIGNMEIIEGHRYYGFTNVISGALSASTYWIKWVSASYGKDIGEGVLFTATSSANPAYCSFYVEGANIDINAKIQMMLIDLTDWYGEGDEPTTIEEFKATFPNKHYPYSKKRPLNKYMINKLEN